MRRHELGALALTALLFVPHSARSATIESDPVFHRESRFHAAAIFDRARNRVIAFGGFSGTTPKFDLQVLDLAVDRGWRPVQATGFGPPDDSFVQGVPDPAHDRMLVLSGGPAGNRVFALDLASFAWDELHPTGTAPPLAFTGAAYDSRRGRVVGFGGFTADSAVSNTWALTLEPSPAWVDLGHAPAPARYQHVAAYDSTGDRLLVIDGFYYDPNMRFRLDDVWQLDLSGTPTWSQVAAAGAPPAPFNAACGIFDEVQHRLVVFGGRHDDATNSNVTHTLSFPGGQATWTQVSDALPTPKVARSNAIGLYDPLGGRLIVTGGSGSFEIPADDRVWTRTLDANPGPWETMAIAGIVPFTSPFLPTTVVGPSAYETSRGAFRVLMLQETIAGFELRDENGLTRWRRRAEGGPPAQAGSVLVRAVPGPVDPVAGLSYAFTGDTLYVLHDGDPDTWTRAPIVPARTGQLHGGMVWLDAPRHRLLCFGPTGGLWILGLGDAPTWTLASDPCPVCDRPLLPMARDSARDRLLITGDDSYFFNLGVWSLDLPTLGWSQLSPSGLVPRYRNGHVETYDPVNDRLVVAGGTGALEHSYTDQIWALQFGKNDPVGRWDRFDLGTQRLADAVSPPTVDVPGLAAFVRALPEQRELVRLGPVSSPIDVVVASPQGWTHGFPMTEIAFEVHNHASYTSPRTVSWRITSGRAWPGYPVTGTLFVDDARLVHAIVPIPDSAAFGGNPMTIVAWETNAPESRDSTEILLVDFEVVGSPLLTGPGDWIWKPGVPDTMPAQIVNRDDVPQTILVTWTVDRNWPGFADSLSIALQQGQRADLGIPLVVPDTAAAGTATMIMLARRLDRPEASSVATIHLHDIATPTRIALVDARAIAGRGVELTWWTPSGAGVEATIERRSEHGAWATRGAVTSDAAGRIAFKDADVSAGERFAYRAGALENGEVEWSEETWVGVPGGTLAFVGAIGAPLSGALRADVRLAADVPARLDAYDVRGRRVASRAFDRPAAGTRHVELGAASPGIYFLRLVQGSEEARARLLVIRGQ